MQTKPILAASAILMALTGVAFTFAPELVLAVVDVSLLPISLLLGQVLGGLYLGFAMLNWMGKGSPTGGIYNRPLVAANFMHFLIAGLALLKYVLAEPSAQPLALWVAAGCYALFAALFSWMMFSSPKAG